MNRQLIAALFCSLVVVTITDNTEQQQDFEDLQQHDDDDDWIYTAPPLTKELYERSFIVGKQRDNFRIDPTTALLFYTDRQSPLCHVVLVSEGKGQLTSGCFSVMKVLRQSFDIPMYSFSIVYRCFENTTGGLNPLDYELRQVKVDRIFPKREVYLVLFTVPENDICQPSTTGHLIANGDLIEDDLGETVADLMRIEENNYELTKEQYEDSFKGMREAFYANQETTFIYYKTWDYGSRKLVPIRECFVTLLEGGRGLVHQKCIETLDNFAKLDYALLNLILPVRCYLKDRPRQYNLISTRVLRYAVREDDEGDDEESQYYIIYKRLQQTDCAPRLGPAMEPEKQEDEVEMDPDVKDEL